jgi:glucokinase
MEARRRARLKDGPGAGEPDSDEPPVSDAAAVFRAAAEGDVDARALVEEAVHALGAGIGGIVNGYNPEVIVVTGGVVKSLARLEREILDCAREYALAPAFAGTRIHLVPAYKSQTVRGGAALVLYERASRAAGR